MPYLMPTMISPSPDIFGVRLVNKGMFAIYAGVTVLAAVVNGGVAVANLIGHDYPKSEARRLGLPESLVFPLGLMLGAGALGLLAGFVVPLLGIAAAGGLVLYFLCALGVHLRKRDFRLGAWAFCFAVAAAALTVNLAYQGDRDITH